MDQRWVVAAAVGLLAVAAGLWWGRGVESVPPSDEPLIPEEVPSTTAATRLVVHVSGWVARPGLVAVRPGARVGDVLAAAGGVEPGAALDALNLAATVADGQQVVVPGPDHPAAPPASGGLEAPEAESRLHLNSATADELQTLPGVGPVLAQRIVDHRDTRGPFQRVEDLLEVSGIGEAKLGSIRDLVAVP